MSEIITIALGALFGAIASIVVSRYSKTKAERESGLASDYLKIADMSGDQLEKKINQIVTLEKRINDQDTRIDNQRKLIGQLKDENETLKRDNENLAARITKMQLAEAERERVERERNKAIADIIEGLNSFNKTLTDILREKEIDIPPRPSILKDRETMDKIRGINFPIMPEDTLKE